MFLLLTNAAKNINILAKKIEDASRKDSPWELQTRDLFVVDPHHAFSDKNNLRIGEE